MVVGMVFGGKGSFDIVIAVDVVIDDVRGGMAI